MSKIKIKVNKSVEGIKQVFEKFSHLRMKNSELRALNEV
jgi:hypothetical protein